MTLELFSIGLEKLLFFQGIINLIKLMSESKLRMMEDLSYEREEKNFLYIFSVQR